MNYDKTFHNSVPAGVVISGTTLTVPGLADDIVALLESSVFGDKLPDNGLGNNYDESDEFGSERISRPKTYDGLLEMEASELCDERSEEQSSEVVISTEDSSEVEQGI